MQAMSSVMAGGRYGQLQNMMKMGPIGKVMQMIPGLGNMLPQVGRNTDCHWCDCGGSDGGDGDDDDDSCGNNLAILTATTLQGAEHGAQERFQSFMTMMDSMTDKELDHPDIQKLLSDTQQVRNAHGHNGSKFPPWAAKGAPSIGRSRIKRIAVGCGQAEPMVRTTFVVYARVQAWSLMHILKVAALVEESKKFQKMVGKMKHLKLDKHGEMAGGHNPQQVCHSDGVG